MISVLVAMMLATHLDADYRGAGPDGPALLGADYDPPNFTHCRAPIHICGIAASISSRPSRQLSDAAVRHGQSPRHGEDRRVIPRLPPEQ
jgi:hypothetical protein